jgi:DNA polymerase-1
VNSPIQGTASDYCLASVIHLVNWILKEKFPAKLILTVHDSIVFDVDKRHSRELAAYAKEHMQSWPSGSVRLDVDVEEGERWGTLEKIAA